MLEQGKVSFGIYTDGLKVHYVDPLVDCDNPVLGKAEQELPIRGIFVPFDGDTIGFEYRPCKVLDSVLKGIKNSPEQRVLLPETHHGLYLKLRRELAQKIRDLNDKNRPLERIYQEED